MQIKIYMPGPGLCNKLSNIFLGYNLIEIYIILFIKVDFKNLSGKLGVL